MTMEETKKENKRVSGAGFVIFREDTLPNINPLMLALVRDDGQLDIPKGTIDEGESSLDAARRECFEECSIILDDGELLFEGKSFLNGPLEVFCAMTSKVPSITRNPTTGIMEHVDHKWLSQEEFNESCLSYLSPAVDYFYSSHSGSYNNT